MNDNRQELINALSVGDVDKVKRLKEDEFQEIQGKMMFASENKDHTWHPITMHLARKENGFKDLHKYPNMSAEDFAAMIVKYDFQVMETTHGVYINAIFPHTVTDPTMTPERKYQEILAYLKELSTRVPEIGYCDEIPKP